MDAGTGGFPHGIEARDRCLIVAIGGDTSHPVMGGGGNRDRGLERVNAVFLTEIEDVGEAVV